MRWWYHRGTRARRPHVMMCASLPIHVPRPTARASVERVSVDGIDRVLGLPASTIRDDSTRSHARDASTDVPRDDDNTANEKYSFRCAVRARLERDARAVVRDDRSSRPRPALGSPRPPPRDPTLDGVLARRGRSTPVGVERTHRSRGRRDAFVSRRSRRHAPSSLVLASKREVETMASPSPRRRASHGTGR